MQIANCKSPGACLTSLKPRRLFRLAILACLVAVATGVFLDGARHRTCPPAHGTGLSGVCTSAAPVRKLRIASFNIHGCRDADGHMDFERTAKVLEGFDVVALNEVHGAWRWQEGNQAQLLGQRL